MIFSACRIVKLNLKYSKMLTLTILFQDSSQPSNSLHCWRKVAEEQRPPTQQRTEGRWRQSRSETSKNKSFGSPLSKVKTYWGQFIQTWVHSVKQKYAKVQQYNMLVNYFSTDNLIVFLHFWDLFE